MAFREVTFKIGTYSYHDWPWDIGLVGMFVFFVAHMVCKKMTLHDVVQDVFATIVRDAGFHVLQE